MSVNYATLPMGVIPIDPLIGEVAAQLLNSISYLWQSNRKLVARRGFPTLMLLVGTQDFDNHTIILQFELGQFKKLLRTLFVRIRQWKCEQ